MLKRLAAVALAAVPLALAAAPAFAQQVNVFNCDGKRVAAYSSPGKALKYAEDTLPGGYAILVTKNNGDVREHKNTCSG